MPLRKSIRICQRRHSDSGTRVVCYCDDCQAFPHHLGNAESVLDSWGGTDIYQMPQARLVISEGEEQIRCLRFGAKGLFRWYCECCKTPIGNTLGLGMPFIGVIHSFMANNTDLDACIGSSQVAVWIKYAGKDAPASIRDGKNPYLLLLRSIWKLIIWKIRGLG